MCLVVMKIKDAINKTKYIAAAGIIAAGIYWGGQGNSRLEKNVTCMNISFDKTSGMSFAKFGRKDDDSNYSRYVAAVFGSGPEFSGEFSIKVPNGKYRKGREYDVPVYSPNFGDDREATSSELEKAKN